MEIYLVRHGETVENNLRILQGHLPGRLTERGRQQVRTTAEELARSGVSFSRIVTSDLKRATDSAQLIADRLLGACIVFHATYNLLISADGTWRIAGYLFPSVLIAFLFAGKLLLSKLKIMFP